MNSPIKLLKKSYTKLVQKGLSRLLRHSPSDLVKRGIKSSQLFRFYLQSLQRINDILYYDYILKKQLSDEEKRKIVNTYFELWKRGSDVVFNQDAQRLSLDAEHYKKVNDYYFDFIKGSIHPLFEAKPKSEVETVKYPLTLSDRFSSLLSADFSRPKAEADITVVYPFRDRDLRRLRLSVKSLYKNSSIGLEVIVVDYGSSPRYASQLQEMAKELDIKVIRSETYGLPWSRGSALNIGIKAANTKYVVTTDMDMIFDGDALKQSLERCAADKVVHCRPMWLPEDGNEANAYLGNYDQLGGYMFILKSVIESLGGFSEQIKFWGLEDSELDKKMKSKDIESVWIDDKVSMYHVWHPFQYGALDVRPISSWEDSSHVFMASGYEQTPQGEWGVPVELADRPILSQMHKSEVNEIKIVDYLNQINHVIDLSSKHKLLKLSFGPRVSESAAEFIEFMIKLDPDFNKYNTELAVKKNKNIDYFYLSLDILKSQGLEDYFLPEEVDNVYLLFS